MVESTVEFPNGDGRSDPSRFKPAPFDPFTLLQSMSHQGTDFHSPYSGVVYRLVATRNRKHQGCYVNAVAQTA